MIFVRASNAGGTSSALLFFLQIGAGRKGEVMARKTPIMEMTRRYGHTVYNVNAFCNPDSNVTYEEKLLTLIKHEADKQADDDKCPQKNSVSA